MHTYIWLRRVSRSWWTLHEDNSIKFYRDTHDNFLYQIMFHLLYLSQNCLVQSGLNNKVLTFFLLIFTSDECYFLILNSVLSNMPFSLCKNIENWLNTSIISKKLRPFPWKVASYARLEDYNKNWLTFSERRGFREGGETNFHWLRHNWHELRL